MRMTHPIAGAPLPVQQAMKGLEGHCRVVEHGERLEVDADLTVLSPHERDIVEFVAQPVRQGREHFREPRQAGAACSGRGDLPDL